MTNEVNKCTCNGQECNSGCRGEKVSPTWKDIVMFIIVFAVMFAGIFYLTNKDKKEEQSKNVSPPILFKKDIKTISVE